MAHLLTKLDARDRIQLVIIAYQSGQAAVLAGPAPARAYGVDVPAMSLEQHEWGIHIV